MKKLKTLCAYSYSKVSPQLDTTLENLYFWLFNKIDWKQWRRSQVWFWLHRKLSVIREIKKHVDRGNHGNLERYVLFFFGLHKIKNSMLTAWWMHLNYVARIFGF